MLYACALTRTFHLTTEVFHLALALALSFHLVTEVFQLVTRYFTFPVRFQLNSNFSHTFLNGQLMVFCDFVVCIYLIFGESSLWLIEVLQLQYALVFQD